MQRALPLSSSRGCTVTGNIVVQMQKVESLGQLTGSIRAYQ
jgi:hypothetical protein